MSHYTHTPLHAFIFATGFNMFRHCLRNLEGQQIPRRLRYIFQVRLSSPKSRLERFLSSTIYIYIHELACLCVYIAGWTNNQSFYIHNPCIFIYIYIHKFKNNIYIYDPVKNERSISQHTHISIPFLGHGCDFSGQDRKRPEACGIGIWPLCFVPRQFVGAMKNTHRWRPSKTPGISAKSHPSNHSYI